MVDGRKGRRMTTAQDRKEKEGRKKLEGKRRREGREK